MSVEFHQTTLSNGLRIISIPMQVESAHVGTWVKVGSRYEKEPENGITHFLEHMLFKDTKEKTAHQIADDIEFIGGKMNAYTGHENTAYHVKVMSENLAEGFNTIADMIRKCDFPQVELDKERGVVIQEIKKCMDEPGDYLDDKFTEQAFMGQSLGRPILGPINVIQSITRQNLFDYVDRHYTPNNMVVAAAGAVNHNQLVDLAGKAYGDMKPNFQAITAAPAVYTGGDVRIARDMEQIQLYTAFEGVGRLHADQPAYNILGQILGGGMSSHLFQHIREERGLVYTVYAFNMNFADTGIWGAYGGLEPSRTQEYVDVLSDTLRSSMNIITERDLQKAKNNFVSGAKYASESAYRQADMYATSLLANGRIRTKDEALAAIKAVTLDDLARVHKEIFASKPTIAAIGNIAQLESYEKFSSRFKSFQPTP